MRAGDEAAGEVALKVACYPGDERFQREVVLLSRVHHPSVPRLLGQGQWEPPRGEAHPFIVMEWVEGLALYTWAEWCNASSHQVLKVLGQLAGAVAATHAACGVHRDIKGGNIRVSLEGARAVLMDFGAGTYPGAAPLTKGVLPPGTDDYRSPEAREYALQRPRGSTETYAAQPADDVFALGVCAYRLVTGWYLPPVEVKAGEEGPWHMASCRGGGERSALAQPWRGGHHPWGVLGRGAHREATVQGAVLRVAGELLRALAHSQAETHLGPAIARALARAGRVLREVVWRPYQFAPPSEGWLPRPAACGIGASPRSIVSQGFIHGFDVETKDGTVLLSIVAFVANDVLNPSCDGFYQYVPAASSLYRWTKVDEGWECRKTGTVQWQDAQHYTLQEVDASCPDFTDMGDP